MDAGGMAQRASASAGEKALGPFVVSQSAVRAMTDRLSHAYEAFRPRDLRGLALASVCMDTVYAPLRRWGSKTGIVCVWGICVDGRKVVLTLSTAHSASYESGLEVVRDLVKRGRQPPGTITTDGAPGLIKALEVMWPRSLRIRCGFHKRQHRHDKGPPQAGPAFQAFVAARRAAPTFADGHRRQQHLLAPSQDPFPEACRCLEDEAEARLTHLRVPARHRQDVRTSHLAARAGEEERRRTKVIPHRWDEARLVKLVFAGLMRVSERWGKKQLSEFEQHHIRAFRQS